MGTVRIEVVEDRSGSSEVTFIAASEGKEDNGIGGWREGGRNE